TIIQQHPENPQILDILIQTLTKFSVSTMLMLWVEKYAPIYIRFPHPVFIQKKFGLTTRQGKRKKSREQKSKSIKGN
ncbi:hypothetical protein, partial [Aphanizomenon sp. UHCC 0183]|uniref:hypothetical protein n=1 Tax=Aphanizomenon sp. UHCC 0183 TaxID=2590028 RepID=UPI001C2C3AAD